jgi:hypothetical protein
LAWGSWDPGPGSGAIRVGAAGIRAGFGLFCWGCWPGPGCACSAVALILNPGSELLHAYYGSLPIIYTNIKINTMHDINLKAEVTATIDELNQYLLGNVTNQAAVEALAELQKNITNYKFN